jgi:hypothetical protein
MIVCVSWLDLSDAQRLDLLVAMEEAFGKRVRDRARFWKCRVYFYYPGLFGDWTGAAVVWSLRGQKGEYMDKFFVRKGPKGEGTRFLQELLQVDGGILLWRTDAVLAERFYGRLTGVRLLGRHGDYIYQAMGLAVSDVLLEMTRLPSAF